MENESLGKLSERRTDRARRSSPLIRRGYNLSRGRREQIRIGECEANFSAREERGETLAFMPRTWQPEKPRSSDRNTTTMRHVSSSSSRSRHEISRDGGGIQCLHHDARKTNLEKFLWCIRCLTPRWLRGRNCDWISLHENSSVSRDKLHRAPNLREIFITRSKNYDRKTDDFIDRFDLSSYCDSNCFGFISNLKASFNSPPHKQKDIFMFSNLFTGHFQLLEITSHYNVHNIHAVACQIAFAVSIQCDNSISIFSV